MKTLKPAIFISLLISISLLLTSCGSSGTASTAAPSAKSIKSNFTFMSDFLDALKGAGVECLGYVKDDGVLMVKEQGTCKYKGQELTLDLFGDEKSTTTLVDSLKSFGGYWLTSNNWVVVVQDEMVAKDLQVKLGVAVK